jgi:hypothetical protein
MNSRDKALIILGAMAQKRFGMLNVVDYFDIIEAMPDYDTFVIPMCNSPLVEYEYVDMEKMFVSEKRESVNGNGFVTRIGYSKLANILVVCEMMGPEICFGRGSDCT